MWVIEKWNWGSGSVPCSEILGEFWGLHSQYLGIQKYVVLAVLQTPVFPLKPPKKVYFFLGHPVPGSGIIPILYQYRYQYECLSSICMGMNHQPGIAIGMND